MGIVFTTKQIKDRLVPSTESMNKVRYHTEQWIHRNNAIIAAVICGTTAYSGTHNIRSDFDVVTICKDTMLMHVLQNQREIIDIAHSIFHLPARFICMTETEARKGWHNINLGFGRHLQRVSSKQYLKQNPMDLIMLPTVSPRQDALNYLGQKINKLQNQFQEQSQFCHAQRSHMHKTALESVMHATRILLDLVFSILDTDDSKPVVTSLAQAFLKDELLESFQKLTTLDRRYTELVEEMLLPNADTRKHDAMLQDITDAVPDVISYLRQCRSAYFSP